MKKARPAAPRATEPDLLDLNRRDQRRPPLHTPDGAPTNDTSEHGRWLQASAPIACTASTLRKRGVSMTVTKARTSLETGQDRFLVSVSKIKPSKENDQLYRPVDLDDPQTIALAESIREFGVREPLVLTLDGFILSGHRRYAAAKLAGLKKVPVRREKIRRSDPQFVRLLREYNRQREKTLDERLREEIVSVDVDDAYSSLVEHRQQASEISAETVTLGKCKDRAGISDAKQPMLDAIQVILAERREFWPMSDRTIHYALLNIKPLRHASKPGSEYANTLKCYKDCCDLLTRARLCGLVPMEAISDETRPVTTWRTNATAGEFIRGELKNFARNYWRDLLQSQPNHIEILVEKNTVEPIVYKIAARYTIPLTSGRGFCSIPPRQQMLQRYRKSGKERMVLIVVSDFDPEGESICESFARSMRDDFGVDISCVKAALTYQQTQELDLPPALQAKETSSRYVGFVEKYGDDVYELEALPPEQLQDLVDEAVRSVIDVDLFNKEQDKERTESQGLDVTRRRLLAAMAEIKIDGGEQ